MNLESWYYQDLHLQHWTQSQAEVSKFQQFCGLVSILYCVYSLIHTVETYTKIGPSISRYDFGIPLEYHGITVLTVNMVADGTS
jgi:hypothetical protein